MAAMRTTATVDGGAFEREAAHGPAAARGLCAQCRAADGCTYGPRVEGRRVWSCDEFDGGSPRGDVREVAPLVARDEADGRPRMGLCANCDLWAGCSFPKPESGVWSCEEYV